MDGGLMTDDIELEQPDTTDPDDLDLDVEDVDQGPEPMQSGATLNAN
jgi:hypothetical protein